MSAVIAVVLFLISWYTISWFKNRRSRKLMSLIPALERSWIPGVGHLHLFYQENQKRKKGEKTGETFFNIQHQFSKQFQNVGISNLDLGIFGDTIMIYKPEMYRNLCTDNDNISKHFLYSLGADYLGPENLFLSTGNTWKVARKHITPAFHHSILDQFEQHFNANASLFCDKVSGKYFKNIYEPISYFLMKSLIETSLGLEVEGDDVANYLEEFEVYSAMIEKRLTTPVYLIDFVFFMTPHGRKSRNAVAKLHKFTTDCIKKRMKILEENRNQVDVNSNERKTKSCLVDTLIREHWKNPKLFTFDSIRYQVDSFAFAGHETTAVTLHNTLFLIALHPHVQKRLQDEIDNKLSDMKEVTSSMFPKLKYLDAVIKESQRFFPAVSTVGRKITKEINIGGFTIPVGVNLLMNLHALLKDPESFEEPEKYNPDRFMPDSQENLSRHPFAFIPFSAGPRNCIGQRFAMNEIRTFLARIVQQFDLSTNITLDQIRLSQSIILRISNEVDMKFTPRKLQLPV